MTRSEKKQLRKNKWNLYKGTIITFFSDCVTKYGWEKACHFTDTFILELTTKHFEDKEVILNCSHEFKNELENEIKKKLERK